MKIRKAVTIDHGWLEGNVCRTARKPHRCQACNSKGPGTGRCTNIIQPGERYVEGEMELYSHPNARERYCLECAGPEARELAERFCTPHPKSDGFKP